MTACAKTMRIKVTSKNSLSLTRTAPLARAILASSKRINVYYS